jgi:hypothetical protein
MSARQSGIAVISAHGLVNEVFHRDFANQRQVAASFELISSPYDKGCGDPWPSYQAGPGTDERDAWRSRWLGCGCVTSPRAVSPSGSMHALARTVGTSGVS